MPANQEQAKIKKDLLEQATSGQIIFGGARMALLDLEAGFFSLRQQIEGLAGKSLADAVIQQAGAQGGASFASSYIKSFDSKDIPTLFRECLASYQAAGFGEFEIETLDWENHRIRVRAVNAFEAWIINRRGETSETPVCAYTAGVLVGFLNVLESEHDLVCIEHVCQAQGSEGCLFELLPAKDAGQIPAVMYTPDPSLGSQLNLLEILFDRMPMSIAIFDRNLTLKRCNPTWGSMIERYTSSKASQSIPGTHFYDMLPGTEATAQPLLDRVLEGETINLVANRVESEGIVSYWDMTLAPLIENGNVVGFIDVSIDATQRVQNEQALLENQRLLEQRVEERTQDLFTVLEVSHTVASTLDLQPLMKLILEQLKTVVNFDGASVMVLDGEQFRILAYQGPIPQKQALEIRFPLDKADVNRQVIQKREPVIVPDVFADTPLARDIRKTAGNELETTFSYMKSWMGVPLIVRDQVIGMISLDHHERNYFQPPQDKLMMAFANQVAVAIENARLYTKISQRADETQTLLSVQKAITSRLDPKMVLQMIADEALRLTETEQSAVYLLEGDELVISVISGDVESEMLGYRLPVDGSVAGQAIKTGKPFLVSDAEKDHRVHAEIIQKVGAKTFVIVPLLTSNGPIGTITVANKRERPLGTEDEWVLTMLASGAVVALENARLYNEEQEQRRQAEQRGQIAEGLRDIVKLLNSDRSLEDILETIVSQASHLLGSKAVVIFKINEDRDSMIIEAAYNMPDTFMEIREMPLIQSEPNQAILNKQPFPVENLQARIEQFSHLLPHLPKSIRDFYKSVRGIYNAELSVPLIIRDEVYGAISLFYVEPRKYSEEDIALAVSFADQAALAIENSRLRSHAARVAVQSERSRLARDLHDAVTQTLFSASLIAEVMPRLWDKNQEEGIRRLGELRELTRGALAEMRTLLLELRPSALIEAEPVELFRHLVEAFTGRARVPIDFQIKGEGDLPPDIKVAFYRIAQEALNNIAKHAEANQVTLNVECEEDRLSLLIKDNGQGFDMGEISHESLGLGIMRERADNIGAVLSIYSEVGEGTQISVSWKKPERSARRIT